jgi:hypothetical protein
MKRAVRILAVLAAVGIAAPVLACGDKMENTKSAEAKPAPQKVAKADKKAAAKKQQAEPKAATAAN